MTPTSPARPDGQLPPLHPPITAVAGNAMPLGSETVRSSGTAQSAMARGLLPGDDQGREVRRRTRTSFWKRFPGRHQPLTVVNGTFTVTSKRALPRSALNSVTAPTHPRSPRSSFMNSPVFRGRTTRLGTDLAARTSRAQPPNSLTDPDPSPR